MGAAVPGLVEFRGNKQNNILPVENRKGHRLIYHDPGDEETPFKMLHFGPGGIRGSISRNGYH